MLAALLGLAVGWVRGGRLGGLSRASLRWFPVLVLGVALLLAAQLSWLPAPAAPFLVGTGYLAAIVMLVTNRDQRWLLPVLAGAVLNAAVIVANGGRMPVSVRALETAGLPALPALVGGTDPRHLLATSASPLGLLDDRLAFHIGGLAGIASPGDVLMAVGVAGFVQAAMVERRHG
ncbi:MAG TPA: DUF5317 family protein [bacterium]|nr:DUF5317 family protein [bacterium]